MRLARSAFREANQITLRRQADARDSLDYGAAFWTYYRLMSDVLPQSLLGAWDAIRDAPAGSPISTSWHPEAAGWGSLQDTPRNRGALTEVRRSLGRQLSQCCEQGRAEECCDLARELLGSQTFAFGRGNPPLYRAWREAVVSPMKALWLLLHEPEAAVIEAARAARRPAPRPPSPTTPDPTRKPQAKKKKKSGSALIGLAVVLGAVYLVTRDK